MSRESAMGYGSTADCGCGCSDRGWGGADVWAAAGTSEGSRSYGDLSGRSADREGELDAWPAEGRPDTGSFETKWPPGGGRPSTLAGWEDVWPATGVAASLSMTPHLLTPPEGWEDYSECEDELRGSEEECLVWVTPRTQGEFWDLRAGDTEDALQIIGATTEETGLAVHVAAVLLHELSHVCGASSRLDGRHCEEAWLTGSNYLYAVYHQYPETVGSMCCASNWRQHNEGASLFGRDSGSDAVLGSSCAEMVSEVGEEGDEGVDPLGGRASDSPIEDEKGMVVRPEWRTR